MKSQAIIEEEKLLQAVKNNDAAALDKLLDDNLIFVNQTGQIISKQMDLEAYNSGKLIIDTLEASERIVKESGDITTIVSRIFIAGKYDSSVFSATLRYTRVWRFFDDKWKVIAGSCVAIADN
ncbi:MAG: nuclear transport factor 2 family protein [Bacteroidetes bacterium]|nr:nuclear transport factor 2 family protein [Bacteroidota bacterium]